MRRTQQNIDGEKVLRVFLIVVTVLAMTIVIISGSDPLRRFLVLSPFIPPLATWILQPVFKYHKDYIFAVFWFCMGCAAFSGRHNYINYRGGGFEVPKEHMIIVSTCLFVMSYWTIKIIRRNKKSEPVN